jgi:hypothetical protein
MQELGHVLILLQDMVECTVRVLRIKLLIVIPVYIVLQMVTGVNGVLTASAT